MNVPSASGASTSTVKIFIFNLAVIDKPNSGLHSLTKPTCDRPCSLEYFNSGWYFSHHSHAATNGSSNLALYSIRRNAKSARKRACSLEYFHGGSYFSHHIHTITNGPSDLALYSFKRNSKSARDRPSSLEYFDDSSYFSQHIHATTNGPSNLAP